MSLPLSLSLSVFLFPSSSLSLSLSLSVSLSLSPSTSLSLSFPLCLARSLSVSHSPSPCLSLPVYLSLCTQCWAALRPHSCGVSEPCSHCVAQLPLSALWNSSGEVFCCKCCSFMSNDKAEVMEMDENTGTMALSSHLRTQRHHSSQWMVNRVFIRFMSEMKSYLIKKSSKMRVENVLWGCVCVCVCSHRVMRDNDAHLD